MPRLGEEAQVPRSPRRIGEFLAVKSQVPLDMTSLPATKPGLEPEERKTKSLPKGKARAGRGSEEHSLPELRHKYDPL